MPSNLLDSWPELRYGPGIHWTFNRMTVMTTDGLCMFCQDHTRVGSTGSGQTDCPSTFLLPTYSAQNSFPPNLFSSDLLPSQLFSTKLSLPRIHPLRTLYVHCIPRNLQKRCVSQSLFHVVVLNPKRLLQKVFFALSGKSPLAKSFFGR